MSEHSETQSVSDDEHILRSPRSHEPALAYIFLFLQRVLGAAVLARGNQEFLTVPSDWVRVHGGGGLISAHGPGNLGTWEPGAPTIVPTLHYTMNGAHEPYGATQLAAHRRPPLDR